MPRLTLNLFGSYQAKVDGVVISRFRSDKVRALLAYLAVESNRVHRRDALASLLWSEMPQGAARDNLRLTLFRLRKALGDNGSGPALFDLSREAIGLAPDAFWLDAAHFAQLVHATTEHDHERLENCSHCIDQLSAAETVYRGDFLQGFHVGDSPEFVDWARVQQEKFHMQALTAIHTLARHHLLRRNLIEAQHYANRLLELEPWHEAAHRHLMEILARQSRFAMALKKYETCRRLLCDELGAEPAPATTALYERIKTAASMPVPNVPQEATAFIGRNQELQTLHAYLADPGCRLVTITGLGGIGKSRIALRLAGHLVNQRFRLFMHGVTFVPLAGVSTDELVPTIGSALGIAFVGHDAPERQLLRYLSDMELLLLLDNYEHLLPDTELLAAIMTEAPRVKLLVTSRYRLALAGEWLYELEGLSYPEPTDLPMDVAEAERYDAVRLFASRARQINYNFSLARSQKEVAHVCRLVQGMPLALEMSAAWLKSLAPDEVVAEMKHGLSLLSSQARNVPERHHSLRAVFDTTWAGLTPAEQKVLRCLSLFYSGFSREAAAAVTGVTLPVLRSLSDKSLIRLTPGGRYEIHELLRQYAAEKLAADPDARAVAVVRYCRFYGAWLQEQEQDLLEARQEEALDEIRAEPENIRRAWRWGVNQGLIHFLDKAIWTLSFFYELQSWYPEALSLMARAVDRLRALEEGDGWQKALWGRLRLFHAHFLNRTGQLAESQTVLEEVLDLLLEHGAARDAAMAFLTLGQDTSDLGDRARAEQYFRQALIICRENQIRWLKSLIEARLCSVLTLKNEQGAWNEAEAHALKGLAFAQQADNPFAIFSVSLYYGRLFRRRGNFQQAQRIHQQGLEAARRINHLAGIGLELREIA